MHYVKLVFRSVLFLAALGLYLNHRVSGTGTAFGGYEKEPAVLTVIWLVFAVEMVFRFFPSKIESMGCQKQFARNYAAAGEPFREGAVNRGVLTTLLVWIALNGAIAGLYFGGIIDKGILLLISLFYSVCDLICILFFCPFQTWFMKNRCCVTCRIYNWDFAMMFTPLIFVDNGYARTLILLALALLVRWELAYRLHPERFAEVSNRSLSCAMCEEKLCHHKKQLKTLWKKSGRN
ncbi:MAG: hypothetical protein IKM31_00850 [Oscillospiraceae bacterium]|nr:hypothetical protein [Oscillospiraceae bacterium]